MKAALRKLIQGESLMEEEAFAVFSMLMGEKDGITEAQIGAFLYATARRNPTSEELSGGVRALREHMVRVEVGDAVPLLDTCGTGGTGHDCFNTSTLSALVCAAAGQPVAKHGNRAATSKCGSADFLEALGIEIELSPQAIAECCRRTNFCFMFAPKHHPATKRVAGLRKQIPFRTIFNFLGPLTNPAQAAYHVLGVSRPEMVPVLAETLQRLGVRRALVVYAKDGMDEISLGAETMVVEVKGPLLKEYSITPESFGFRRVPLSELPGGTPVESAEKARAVLSGEKSGYRDLVLLNAAAGLYVSENADSLEAGLKAAEEVIDSGKANEVLELVRTYTTHEASN